MKYIWEAEDLDNCWGLLVKRGEGDYKVVGGDGFSPTLTCLNDGLVIVFEGDDEKSTFKEKSIKVVEFLNKGSYEPVVAPINLSKVLPMIDEKKFNYGAGIK